MKQNETGGTSMKWPDPVDQDKFSEPSICCANCGEWHNMEQAENVEEEV